MYIDVHFSCLIVRCHVGKNGSRLLMSILAFLCIPVSYIDCTNLLYFLIILCMVVIIIVHVYQEKKKISIHAGRFIWQNKMGTRFPYIGEGYTLAQEVEVSWSNKLTQKCKGRRFEPGDRTALMYLSEALYLHCSSFKGVENVHCKVQNHTRIQWLGK